MWKYVYGSQKHHNFVCYRPPTILHPSATPSLLPAKWIGHANLLWELHKQEVAKFNDSKRAGEKQHARSLARLKKELEEERERIYAAVSDERDASVAQLREAQEVGVGLDSSSRFCETLHDFHACLLLMCLGSAWCCILEQSGETLLNRNSNEQQMGQNKHCCPFFTSPYLVRALHCGSEPRLECNRCCRRPSTGRCVDFRAKMRRGDGLVFSQTSQHEVLSTSLPSAQIVS